MEYNSLTSPAFDNERAGIGTLGDEIPSACAESHYFSYGIATAEHVLTATATRCGAGGRGGANSAEGKTLVLTTTFPEGTDVWAGGY